MKAVSLLGVAFLVMIVALGCNQNRTKEEKSNEYEQIPEGEQRQMQDQPEQNPAPFQQPTQETEVSDEELKEFAEVAEQVQIINQEVQQKMMNALEAEAMDAQRFTEIHQAQQNPEQNIDATSEEMKKYEATTREFEKIQGQAQQKMQEKITESDLTMPRYEEIAMILQSDPELQEKFQMIQQGNK
ncbi:MAG: DUF4168 domain-containing protein [Bacteroidota bacterium]